MKMKKLGIGRVCAIIAILALLVLCWYVFKAGVWCGEAHKTFAVREAFKAGMNSKINFTLSDGSSVPDDERDACLNVRMMFVWVGEECCQYCQCCQFQCCQFPIGNRYLQHSPTQKLKHSNTL